MNQETVTAVRRRLPSKGELTRQAILEAAADLASIDGLEGLSIGNLAKAVGMSKSGLYAHFGSKEELQLAAIETAREIVKREVMAPVFAMEPGLGRLWALSERYISYNQHKVFPGGCFFGNVGAELDAHPGPLRDRIARIYGALVARFVEAVRGAQAAGELDAAADADQLAFEIVALIREATRLFLLDDNAGHYARARWAIVQRLRPLATPKAPPLPDVPLPEPREAGPER